MSDPAREEPPIILGLTLGGYFLGLVLLQLLGFEFVLAPIPVAMCTMRGQHDRIPFFIVVAGLAGVMSLVMGQVTLVIPTILFALMGIPIAKAIQRQKPYIPLILVTGASVLLIQLIAMSLQWDGLTVQRQHTLGIVQSKLTGPEASSLSDQAYTQLKMQIWVFEHWNDVFLGIVFSGALAGACLSIGWMFRALRRSNSEIEPSGSFSQFRPQDTVVWLVIATAAMAFLNYRYPQPWLQTISYTLAPGLFTLYSLSGLAIVLHALKLWKPNPWLIIAGTLILLMASNILFLTFLGLFDTWGDFRQRMNERVRVANDSQDHFE